MIEQNTINLEPSALVGKVYDLHEEGYRLVQINCTKKDEQFEFNYTFDKDLSCLNLRLNCPMDTEIMSISGIYLCAFIYENEMHDLFGVNVKNMKVDYQGNLYKTSIKTPMNTTENK